MESTFNLELAAEVVWCLREAIGNHYIISSGKRRIPGTPANYSAKILGA